MLDLVETTLRRILDVGSGNGGSIQVLRRRFSHSETISVDVDKERCKYVSMNVNSNVICTDATSLPLRSKYFDLVVCDNAIEHVEEQDKLVDELARVLTDKGDIIWGSVLRKRFAISCRRNVHGNFVIDPNHTRAYRSREEFKGVITQRFRITNRTVSSAYTSLPIDLYRFGIRIGLFSSSKNHIKYNPSF